MCFLFTFLENSRGKTAGVCGRQYGPASAFSSGSIWKTQKRRRRKNRSGQCNEIVIVHSIKFNWLISGLPVSRFWKNMRKLSKIHRPADQKYGWKPVHMMRVREVRAILWMLLNLNHSHLLIAIEFWLLFLQGRIIGIKESCTSPQRNMTIDHRIRWNLRRAVQEEWADSKRKPVRKGRADSTREPLRKEWADSIRKPIRKEWAGSIWKPVRKEKADSTRKPLRIRRAVQKWKPLRIRRALRCPKKIPKRKRRRKAIWNCSRKSCDSKSYLSMALRHFPIGSPSIQCCASIS